MESKHLRFLFKDLSGKPVHRELKNPLLVGDVNNHVTNFSTMCYVNSLLTTVT